MKPKFTFRYQTSALGLGGVLQDVRGVTTIKPSLASVVLPPSGGEGCIKIENYDDKRGVSFSNARSHVMGYDSGYHTFTTSSEVYITNLNLFGRLKVAILQMKISSTREVVEAKKFDPDSTRFSIQSMISGLTIDGVEVVPKLDSGLCECQTYRDFAQRVGKASYGYARQFGVEEADLAMLAAKALPIHGSFFNDIEHKPTDKFGLREGFALPVKNFGTIHFGELVVETGHRSANLLRIEFDSTLGNEEGQGEEGLIGKSMQMKPMALSSVEDLSGTTPSPSKGTMTVVAADSDGAPNWP